MSHSSQEKMGNYNADGKKEHKLMCKGLAVALAGAVALGAAGCSGDKVGAKAPEVKPSTTTEAPVAPEKEAETTEKQTNTEEYTQDMEFYKQMGVEEFEELPIEERLKYAQFLIDQTIERGNYDMIYPPGDEYSIGEISVNKDNTGSEIFNSFQKSLQIACLQFIEGDYNPKPFDVNDSHKLLSAFVFDPNGETHEFGYVLETYLNNKNFMASLEKPTGVTDYLSFEGDLGGLLIGEYDGREFYYKDIATKSIASGEDIYQRYVYCEFDSYDGSQRGAWLLESQEASIEDVNRTSALSTFQDN